MTIYAQILKIAGAIFAGASLIACAHAKEAAEPSPGPALWRVSDADTTIYLFGLPGFIDSGTRWRNPAFDAALGEADTVIMESDRTSPEAQAAMQQVVPQTGVYRDGRTLTGVLGDETRARAESIASSLGVPLQALDPLKPWLAANQLQAVMTQRDGLMNP